MLNTFILLISITLLVVLQPGPAYCSSTDITIINKSARENVLSVRLKSDISLYELITKSGYNIADEDVAAFLAEFTRLNEDIKSISSIKKGTTIKLPLQKLKKAGNELAISGETSEIHAIKRKIAKKKEDRKQEIQTNLLNKEMILKNIRILTSYLYDNTAVETKGFKFFNVNEKTEISLDTSYFPVIDLNNERILIVDYSGILPEGIKDIVELTWPEYRVVNFKDLTNFKKITGSLLESMGYNVNEDTAVVVGGRTRIEYNADFLIYKKTGDILDSKIWIVGIVDNAGYSTPESLINWFRKQDVNLIELNYNEINNRHAGGADASFIDSGSNAQGFTETVLTLLGYKYSSNTSHSLSGRKEFTYNLKADLSINLGYRTKIIEFSELSGYEINFLKKNGVDIASIKPLEERRVILSKIMSLLSLHYSGSVASVSSNITPKGVKYRLLSPGFFVNSIKGPIFFTDSELEQTLLKDIIRDKISVIKF